MPAKKKIKSPSKKKIAKSSPAKKKAIKKTAAKKKSTSGAKKAAPAKKKAAPARKKSAPAKKKTPKAKKKTVSKAPQKKQVAKKKLTKGKSGKNTPAIFKVKPKKPGPSNFTLEDVEEHLKKKEKKEARKKRDDPASPPRKVAATPSEKLDNEINVEKRSLGAASVNDILGISPDSGSNRGGADEEEKNVPRKWLKYYRALIKLSEEVSDELKLHTSETLKRSSRDDTGDLSGYGQHQADAGTDTFDRDLALSMVSSEKEALYEIEEAIKRILNGTYGVCEITGKPISKARLEAVPFTRFSVEGQRQWEKMNRRKVERGGVFSDTDESLAIKLGSDDEDDD